MTSLFSNTGYMGIPLVLIAFGEAEILPMVIAAVLLASVFVPITTVLLERDTNPRHGGALIMNIGGALVRKPMIVSPIAGVLWSVAGPCALFAIGLFLVDKPLRRGLDEVGAMVALKLFLHPLVTAVLAVYVFELEPLWSAIAILAAALPSGATCFVLAQQYGVYVERTSAAILISTVISMFTISALFAWVLP
jgi:hypothetical protein